MTLLTNEMINAMSRGKQLFICLKKDVLGAMQNLIGLNPLRYCSGDILSFFFLVNKYHEKTQTNNELSIVCLSKPDISYYFVQQSSIIVDQKLLKTQQSATIIPMNTHTIL